MELYICVCMHMCMCERMYYLCMCNYERRDPNAPFGSHNYHVQSSRYLNVSVPSYSSLYSRKEARKNNLQKNVKTCCEFSCSSYASR